MTTEIEAFRRDAAANPVVREREARTKARADRAHYARVHDLPGLVFADLVDHGLHTMPIATAHITVWVSGDPEAALINVDHVIKIPEGVTYTIEIRRARWRHHAIGWWRVARDLWWRRLAELIDRLRPDRNP